MEQQYVLYQIGYYVHIKTVLHEFLDMTVFEGSL
jgi:hypothetical protein